MSRGLPVRLLLGGFLESSEGGGGVNTPWFLGAGLLRHWTCRRPAAQVPPAFQSTLRFWTLRVNH